jgi:hypothetical protein
VPLQALGACFGGGGVDDLHKDGDGLVLPLVHDQPPRRLRNDEEELESML